MFCRVNAYIEYGWSNELVDPDKPDLPDTQSDGECESLTFPTNGWVDIRSAYKSPNEVPEFNYSQIITYFVTRTVSDGLPVSDFKSSNVSADNLFKCGHVQNIQVNSTSELLLVKGDCLPEMRKDCVYKLIIHLGSDLNIISAQCGCPAGKGPTASCKHIGALCYALANFCTCGKLPDFITCTEKLQEWNRPRGKKVQPIPVEDFIDRKHEILGNYRQAPAQREYNPRPPRYHTPDVARVELLRRELLAINHDVVLLHLLCPPLGLIEHDHCYYSKSMPTEGIASQQSVNHVESDDLIQADEEIHEMQGSDELLLECLQVKLAMQLSQEEQIQIEIITREQSQSQEWHRSRMHRITGSRCGKILNQKKKTVPLLQSVLYAPKFIVNPKPIQWGKDNEQVACQMYTSHMRRNGHPDLCVHKCGFIIHSKLGWLGASPDGRVTDPSLQCVNGIVEFKCPYAYRDKKLQEACKDEHFYCGLNDNGTIFLKVMHQYYHQVQLQLFVGSDMFAWCDFCIYSTKGVLVQRIFPDLKWRTDNIPKLEEYYDNFMLPEIVFPQNKPPYIL